MVIQLLVQEEIVMKPASLKSAFASASILVMVGNADIALAHTESEALPNSATATDLYTVNCPTDTHHLESRVKDNGNAGAPFISVQTYKGTRATNTTDTNTTSANSGYSQAVQNHSGKGVYRVLVNKTSSGSVSYTLQVHCEDQDGVEIPDAPDPVLIQDDNKP
jgi:hypothetical protein